MRPDSVFKSTEHQSAHKRIAKSNKANMSWNLKNCAAINQVTSAVVVLCFWKQAGLIGMQSTTWSLSH